MTRKPATTEKTFHTPMRMDWTSEKLEALSQDQLLNLLQNLDHQRTIGRVSDSTATEMDARITSLLSRATQTKRSKQLAANAPAVTAESE